MASRKKLRLGLIGCGGNMCRAHMPRLKQVGGVDVVAATDPIEQSVTQAGEAWGSELAGYANYRKMIREQELDGVLISTPHTQHYQQIRDSLKAGLHVLVEKPMTTTSARARSLLKLAAEKELILHVAYQRHHMPIYRHVRNLIAKGKIGELRGVVGYVTQNWGRAGTWRLVPELSGGGMFMDTGSHLVAASLFLSGLEVRRVVATVDNAGRDVDINASVSIRYHNDAVGSLVTVGNARDHDESLSFHGSDGQIVMHQHQWRITRVLMNGEAVEPPKSMKDDNPDAAFVRWIRGGQGYEQPAYTIDVAKISESTYKSAQSNKAVTMR